MLFTGGELTYGRGGGVLGEGIGIFPGVSIFINANLFYTCYLFTPKLFHNCKWGISIRLKSKTNNGNAPAMRKDFRYENISGCCISKKNFIAPFYGWGSTASMLQSHQEEIVYFLPISPQKFLVLLWSTSERWKAEFTLEPTSSFELGTPRLGIRHLNH